MNCDGLRRSELFRARGSATVKWRSPIVERRVAGAIRSADDAHADGAVVPRSRPSRWRFADSLVWTRVHTDKPVRTACTAASATTERNLADWGYLLRVVT